MPVTPGTSPVQVGQDVLGRWWARDMTTGRFMPHQAAIDLLKPSVAGYHGYEGRFQSRGFVAHVLGEGRPSSGHKWWYTEEGIARPDYGTVIPP
ncbi:unnamed protein product, partial [marine sediment metagenome]